MNRLPAAWNRLSVGLVGLLLVVVGLALLFSQVTIHPLSDWDERIDSDAIDRAAHQDWWTWVLVGIVALAVLWGFRLLATLIRPQAVERLVLDGSEEGGRMTIPPGLIASAVSDDLKADPLFEDVSVKALDDRGAKLIRIVVTAPAHRTYDEVSAALAVATEQIEAAVGDTELHVQTMVQFAPPRRAR
ncbi:MULTISPECIES: hypothetical protein [unclassified Gordonia (in: high G+C Gram-positive bacteria)]|uniref:hypothetical protein n=1 Tax=unclassified Gordonia (in: high G+C Gram-positive bacteria) TaxID=2657482 RepID=UPI001FFF5296|nr:hypothetical protein [Gordonia sp. PP30]UQE75276.1 hypothetical protein MYK68_01135 [Gordonia sp. PP30]